MSIVNQAPWIPSYSHNQEHIYILLTSLNLGGAEKIVSDQLWENHYSKFPKKVTLLVIYDKEKEHSIPPEVNVVRLNGKLANGELLLRQLVFEAKPLVCHLLNDSMANYLFSLGIHIHLVIHNDKRGWNNLPEIFNHPQVISLVAVCNYVKEQLAEVSNKPIFVFRHQINQRQFRFRENLRQTYREQLKVSEDTIVIGMTGRICNQKNYFLALDVVFELSQTNPNYKLVILGGIEKVFTNLYLALLNKINQLKIHKHVVLAGFKTDAYAWLNSFDIGLNTSYYEGLSMATQEFMMNGLPMVLSNVSGQKEIYNPQNQLHFFNLPENLQSQAVQKFHMKLENSDIPVVLQPDFQQYQKLVGEVAELIRKKYQPRTNYSPEILTTISHICYGSHNNWTILHSIKPAYPKDSVRPAFLTSNLNLGGAQRSLINVLTQFQSHGHSVPLILLNQSNQVQFYNEIIEHNIPHFLCHISPDVFDICANLFDYISKNQLTRIVLWNVDTKIKLMLSKFMGHLVEIVDVSPGDYCFVEMDNETTFQQAIYYDKSQFYANLLGFVSKYHIKSANSLYKSYLKNEPTTIPNGVLINPDNFRTTNQSLPFKFLVCGRIAPSKHLEIIFEAFNQLEKIYPDITIDVYGSVESYYQDYYNELNTNFSPLIISKKINWKGHHSTPQIIMKEYHSIVVLGTHQGSPNVVLEAASCKVPVIANDSGGTREIINENTGILLPEIPNPQLLFNAMEDMVENYALYQKKSEHCLDLLNEKFSLERMYQEYYKVVYE